MRSIFFDERGGNTIHNRLDVATDMLGPAHYFVLHPPFLASAWRRYRYGWPRWNLLDGCASEHLGIRSSWILSAELPISDTAEQAASGNRPSLRIFFESDDRNPPVVSSYPRLRHDRPHLQYVLAQLSELAFTDVPAFKEYGLDLPTIAWVP